jgi:hypothetical protein
MLPSCYRLDSCSRMHCEVVKTSKPIRFHSANILLTSYSCGQDQVKPRSWRENWSPAHIDYFVSPAPAPSVQGLLNFFNFAAGSAFVRGPCEYIIPDISGLPEII